MKNKTFNVLGTMSGTSMDGIDMSILTTNGIKIFEFGHNHFIKFSKELRDDLYKLLRVKDELDLHKNFIKKLDISFSKEYAFSMLDFVNKNQIDLVGFHGQTIFHDPENKKTFQLGNGQLISNILNKKLIYDFRSKDLLNNGQGAPLAPIYHKLIIKCLDLSLPSCILNIGGVSNITYWDGNKLIGFDTGPGNSLIDDLTMKFFNKNYDKNGKFAFSGKIYGHIIDKLIKDPFFTLSYPKSLDRQYFTPYLTKMFKNYDHKSLITTLSEFTAISVSKSLNLLPKYPTNLIITGGGAKNLFIIERLKKHVKCKVCQLNSSNFHPDYVESQLIGFLAARSANNFPYTFPSTTGVSKPTTGGILCKPIKIH